MWQVSRLPETSPAAHLSQHYTCQLRNFTVAALLKVAFTIKNLSEQPFENYKVCRFEYLKLIACPQSKIMGGLVGTDP